MSTSEPISSGRLPDFLVIGSMKSGSTTLHDYLAGHPKLAAPKYKEPGFFSRDERFSLGLDWYRTVFADAKPGQLAFESSTCYTRWPHFGEVAPRIWESLPHIKLVYIMRHPVERAYSHYRHAMLERSKKGTGPVISFDDALSESDEYFDTGCYLRQIERFTALYAQDRFFFLTLDELKAQPEATLVRIQEFLDIPVEADLSKVLGGASNTLGDRAFLQNNAQATERLQRSPWVRVAKRLVPKPVRAGVREAIMNSPPMKRRMKARAESFTAQLQELTPERRMSLLDRYTQPNASLSEFLGRPLPDAWLA